MGSLGPLASLLFLAALLSRELAALQAPPAPGPLPLLQALQEQAPGGRDLRALPASGQPLRYMLNLYRRAADREGRPRRDRGLATNTVRLVRASSSGGQPWAGRWYAQPLTYRLEGRPAAERLLRAVVAYPQSLPLAHGRLLCALELAAAGEAPPVLLGPPARRPRGWAEADVTPYLAAGNNSGAALALQLRHVCVRAGRASGRNDTAVVPSEPFLLLYLNDTRAGLQPRAGGPGPLLSRRAREAANLAQDLPGYLRDQGGEKSDCSLRSFHVSFAQLGWDHWIIAPHRYNPRYCKGACPRLLRYDYHAPNHAVVQNFVHQLVDASVPRPSCVPYRYSPISVLMIEHNGGILYKEYENMIAESCTCR
ncbi:bone morphogenetic protein 15 [Apteryx mantelli]|uniref:Bone morphogenetic protein 15 n=1 Tax=Apteryx mantelli TaxID=2696672 RepID=A0ABM4F6G5_9AVES